MNWETIVVALIAALGPLIGTILTIRQQSHFIDYRMELVEKQVKALSDKVASTTISTGGWLPSRRNWI